MALYRKYRPATFAEVVGQEHVTDPLSIALDTGRISHAYLFSGPRGCGKTSSARILARSLNCVEGPTSTPCGVCHSCVALGPGGSGNLDVIELDAASHGGVDDTRELRDRAFYAPAESRYRVFIVDEAHMVTTAGFNALLKIVEEPPAHLIFVFATTEPEKVLPTIRSRTHHYPFRLLPPATMRGLLGKICDQENVQVEESVYPLVIRAGGGSPRDSLSVLDQLLAGAGPDGVTYPRAVSLLGVTDVALIDDAVLALAAGDGATLFGTIDRVVEAGHDPRRFATDLLERLRDLILLRAVPDAIARNLVTGPGDVLDRMQDQANRIGPAGLARFAELLHEGLGDMRGATAPRLLLEVVAARMLLPAASDAETATLQRLENLERRMAGGAPLPPAAQSVAPARSAAPAPQSAPAAPQPTSGEPRRRGAEALAALRGTRDPQPESPQGGTPAQQGAAPAATQAVAAPAQSAVAQPQQARSVPVQQQAADPAPVHAPAAAPVQPAQSSAVTPEGVAAQADSQGQSRPAAIRPPEMSAARVTPIATAPANGAAAARNSTTAVPAGSDIDAVAHDSGTHDAASAAAPQPVAAAEDIVAQPVSEVVQPDVSRGPVDSDQPISGAGEPVGLPLDDASADLPRSVDAQQQDPAPAFAFAVETASEAADSVSVEEPALESQAPEAATNVPAADVQTEPALDVAAPEIQAPVTPVEVAAPAAEPVVVSPAVASPPVFQRASLAPPVEEPIAAPEPVVDTPVDELSAASSDEVLREIEAAWADIRAKVREFGATVQAMLSGASVARLEGQKIVFAHPNEMLAQRLAQPKNLEAVRSAVLAVLGREHEVMWEVGGAAAPVAKGAGKGPGASGPATKKETPRFSRPSQVKSAPVAAAPVAAPTGWGSTPSTDAPGESAGPGAGGNGPAEDASAGPDSGARDFGSGVRNSPPEDDIPLPDGPDLPDDPGPSDYSPVGYDGVPPATTPEEERELLAAAAVPVPAGERRDPDDVALELLRSELGATPLEG